MELDPIGAVQSAISSAPLAALTAALLIGPTLVWILVRQAFSKEKRRAPSSGRMLWACPQCSSVNESVHDRCYTCHFEPQTEDEVTIIDPATGRPLTPVVKPWVVRTAQAVAPPPPSNRPSVPVGPGRTLSQPRPIASPAPAATAGVPVLVGTREPAAPTTAADAGVLHRVGVRRPFDPPSRR